MEYGAAYLRPERNSDDDSASMLSENRASQYQPYRPDDRRQSSDATSPRAWTISPVALQQSLPPPLPEHGSSNTGASIFGNRAVLDFSYQEPVAWENSTQFRTAPIESPKPENRQTIVTLAEPAGTRRYFRHPRHIPEPWKSGFWVRFPWLGFGALFGTLLLTGASAGILLASNCTTPDDWRVGTDNAQPPVYISIFEMIINFLMLFALVDGMAIRFWRQLLCGTTLSTMHDTYESSFLWPAVRRIIRLQFNVVAVACTLAVATALRGPLFQRALTLEGNNVSNTTGLVNLRIAPYPIGEYFQSSETDPRKQGGTTAAFSSLLKDLSAGNALPYNQPVQCGDSCTGIVKGFSFSVNCTTGTKAFDLNNLPQECKSCTTPQCRSNCDFKRKNDLSPTFFSIGYDTDTTSSDVQKQALIFTSNFKNESSCNSNIQVHTCTLTQVTSDYKVAIANNTINRIGSEPYSTIYKDVLPLNETLMEQYWPLAFDSLFPSVSISVSPAVDFSRLQYLKCTKPSNGSETLSDCSNMTNNQAFPLMSDGSVAYATDGQAPAGQDALCGLTWRDPMQDMISKMQSLAFRVTVDMANSNGSVFAPTYTGTSLATLRQSWNQTISTTGQVTRTVYKTNKILVTLGIILSVISVTSILPLYIGFWELGRKVSLNPLEIARAFGAPLMDGMDGNTTPEMVTVERGGMAVRYGALERFNEEKKLRVEESARATVRRPWENEVLG